jgi:hypothetical protein
LTAGVILALLRFEKAWSTPWCHATRWLVWPLWAGGD